MKKLHLILILFAIGLSSCNIKDECNQLCFTPPQGFIFEIVDKSSGENLFTNGTYNPDQIEIINTITNSRAEFTFNSENNINLIQISSIGWETEIVNLRITIADNDIFELYVDAERKKGSCCDHTEYNKIEIKDAEFEFDSQIGIYKILAE